MEPAKENMTMKTFSRILLLASFTLAGVLLAHAQQPSQSAAPQKQEAKPAAAKPAAKVWTDDDLTSLRSPADDYQMQQEEEKKAQAAAAQASSKPVADPSMPKTVQQAESMIADKSRYLTSEQDYLQRLQKQLKDTAPTGLEKERLEWRLKSHTATTQTLQSQIKQLEADKAALAKKAASGNSNSAPPQS
jgi:murein L,D-transpeptidase YcbB/YkuD